MRIAAYLTERNLLRLLIAAAAIGVLFVVPRVVDGILPRPTDSRPPSEGEMLVPAGPRPVKVRPNEI